MCVSDEKQIIFSIDDDHISLVRIIVVVVMHFGI